MPTAIGKASRRHGIEKKVPKEATAHPAAITSIINGTGRLELDIVTFTPMVANPKRRPAQIMSTMTAA
jgi:hypothetical protein